jgi:hypothetical protein
MASAADSERHLWLPSPAGESYKYFVAAVSNLRWPLASALPQVAVCGFFPNFEAAQDFQAKHQRYKDSSTSIPDGPIYMILETARLFPLGLSPRRLLGDQSEKLARKRDAVVRNYYRKRNLDKQEVARRKGKEDAPGKEDAAAAGKDVEKDKRLKRTVQRRARRQAWELLQRLYAQKDRVERARQAVLLETKSAPGGDSDELLDAEMRDFLASLSEAERAAFAEGARTAAEGGGAGAGAAGDAVSPATEVHAKKLTEVAKNTRLGSIDEYIAWAVQHFKGLGIEPASEDMMDAEERKQELEELAKVHGGAAGFSPHSQFSLPKAEGGFEYCVGTIFFDTSGEALNADCPEALGKEHVVTFFEPFVTAEAAKAALESTYKSTFSEEKLFYVRMGQWCCFDHVTEDDGQQVYREEMIDEMFKSHAENSMLKFVEESFKHRPDVLPIPTTK